MNRYERRLRLLEVLCIRRHDTYNNLAKEFQVCPRTIRYDVEDLSCRFPIRTVTGRHGGVYVDDGYYLTRKPSDDNALNVEQIAALRRAILRADAHDGKVIEGVVIQFAPRPLAP